MKGLAIALNIFLPGVGTLVIGKIVQGIVQIVLYGLGVVLSFTVVGAIIGVPLCIGIWIWGLVSAAGSSDAPLPQVIVTQNVVGGSMTSPPSALPDPSEPSRV